MMTPPESSCEARQDVSGGNDYLTSKYEFKETWTWPKDVDTWMERELGNLTEPTPEPIVHVCSGSSNLGQVTVDAFHPAADVRGDALNLPFDDGGVGTVVTDPPWEWDPVTRMKFGTELHRVLEDRGLLLWCAPWLPAQGMFDRDKLVVAAARVGMPKNARLLVRARKRPPRGSG